MILLEFESRYEANGKQKHQVVLDDLLTANIIKKTLLEDENIFNIIIIDIKENKEL